MKVSLGAKPMAMPAPVWIVCTYDENGKPNAMNAAWGGMCCSKPAALGVALRAATYTHHCIAARQAFTVNVATEAHAQEADYFGLASGRNTDKFNRTGLTPVRSDKVDAPYIQEFPLILECKVMHVSELGLHTHFVGEIIDIKVDDSVLDQNGVPDMAKIKPLIYQPEARVYFSLGGKIGQAHSMGRTLLDQDQPRRRVR